MMMNCTSLVPRPSLSFSRLHARVCKEKIGESGNEARIVQHSEHLSIIITKLDDWNLNALIMHPLFSIVKLSTY